MTVARNIAGNGDCQCGAGEILVVDLSFRLSPTSDELAVLTGKEYAVTIYRPSDGAELFSFAGEVGPEGDDDDHVVRFVIPGAATASVYETESGYAAWQIAEFVGTTPQDSGLKYWVKGRFSVNGAAASVTPGSSNVASVPLTSIIIDATTQRLLISNNGAPGLAGEKGEAGTGGTALPVLPDVTDFAMFGDSNMGTAAAVNNFISELSGPLGPWSKVRPWNMGQTGITLAYLVEYALDPDTDRNAAPVNAPDTQQFNFWAARGCEWVLLRLPVNDLASPANRADPNIGGPGAYEANLKTAVDLFLGMSPNLKLILMTPGPLGGDDFSTVTQWASDSPDGTAATNAAIQSQRLLAAARFYHDYAPRVFVCDTSEVYCPGALSDITLFRCDHTDKNCLRTDANPSRFTIEIVDGIATISNMTAGMATVGGLLNFPGVVPGTVLGTQISGLGGRPGNYNIVHPNVGPTAAGHFTKLIFNSLHPDDLGWREEWIKFAKDFGLWGRRSRAGIMTSVGFQPQLLNVQWSTMFYMQSQSKQGANMLCNIPIAVELACLLLNGIAGLKRGSPGLPVPSSRLDMAETISMIGDYATYRQIVGIPRGPIKYIFPDRDPSVVYTATAAVHSQTAILTDGTAYATFFLNGVDSSASGVTPGRCFMWVENPDSVPFAEQRKIPFSHTGTKGAGINPYALAWTADKAIYTRSGSLGGAVDVDLRIHNLTDGRFVEGSVNFGTAAGMMIGTWNLANGVLRDDTLAINTTNRDAMIAAGLWPADTTFLHVRPSYWFDISPSVTTDPGGVLISQK